MKVQRMPPPHLLEARNRAQRERLALQLEMRDAILDPSSDRIADLAQRMEALADEMDQIRRDIVEAVSATHH